MGMYICAPCVSQWRPEEGVDSLGPGVTDVCELPYKYLDLNMGPLEKQTVLLTAEPFLQPLLLLFKFYIL